MATFSPDRSFGIAAEIACNQDEESTGGEVFVFAGRSAGPWAVAINAGIEREEGDIAAVYA